MKCQIQEKHFENFFQNNEIQVISDYQTKDKKTREAEIDALNLYEATIRRISALDFCRRTLPWEQSGQSSPGLIWGWEISTQRAPV